MGYVKGLTTYRNGLMTESEIQEAMAAYNGRYTYADYLTWDDDIRFELIDGVAYMMAAPNVWHQKISRELSFQFTGFLKGKSCEVFAAPISVRLNADTLDDTVVEPDLIVVCDDTKIIKACIKGAPDLVVEILSPSTAQYDKTTKFYSYLRAGVRELWNVDPEAKTLAVNILSDGNYITHSYTSDDTVPVSVLEGLSINLSEVFDY